MESYISQSFNCWKQFSIYIQFTNLTLELHAVHCKYCSFVSNLIQYSFEIWLFGVSYMFCCFTFLLCISAQIHCLSLTYDDVMHSLSKGRAAYIVHDVIRHWGNSKTTVSVYLEPTLPVLVSVDIHLRKTCWIFLPRGIKGKFRFGSHHNKNWKNKQSKKENILTRQNEQNDVNSIGVFPNNSCITLGHGASSTNAIAVIFKFSGIAGQWNILHMDAHNQLSGIWPW